VIILKEFNNFFLGTKNGICPFCGRTKTLLLIRGGIVGCKDCLDNLASILKIACNRISKEKLMEKMRIKELKGW